MSPLTVTYFRLLSSLTLSGELPWQVAGGRYAFGVWAAGSGKWGSWRLAGEGKVGVWLCAQGREEAPAAEGSGRRAGGAGCSRPVPSQLCSCPGQRASAGPVTGD